MPRSIIRCSTSVPSASGPSVSGSTVMMVEMGALVSAPLATTLPFISRTVTMPRMPVSSTTQIEEMLWSCIRAAASRIRESGAQVTGLRDISSSTGSVVKSLRSARAGRRRSKKRATFGEVLIRSNKVSDGMQIKIASDVTVAVRLATSSRRMARSPNELPRAQQRELNTCLVLDLDLAGHDKYKDALLFHRFRKQSAPQSIPAPHSVLRVHRGRFSTGCHRGEQSQETE